MKTAKSILLFLLCLFAGGISAQTEKVQNENSSLFYFADMECRVYGGLVHNVKAQEGYNVSTWYKASLYNVIEYYVDLPASSSSARAWLSYDIGSDLSAFDVYVNDVYCNTLDAYMHFSGYTHAVLHRANLKEGRNKISFVFMRKNGLATNPYYHKAGFHNLSLTYPTINTTIDAASVVGSAVPRVGWDLTNAPLMRYNNSMDALEWTGCLQEGEFKLVSYENYTGVTNSDWKWAPSINPLYTQVLEDGKAYPMQLTNGINGDHKFYIAKAGSYKLSLNRFTLELSVEKADPSALYIVGDATSTGWDNTISEGLEKTENGSFVWNGFLKKGHFKFILERGTWISLVPGHPAHEDVLTGYKHPITDNYQGDYRFVINKEGYYNIIIDYDGGAGKGSMLVQPADGDSTLITDVYLIGDATPTGWDNTKAGKLQHFGGWYSWQGYLKAGHFKFITELGTWKSLVPAATSHYDIPDLPSGCNVAMSNIYRGDYRFGITRSGYYNILLNVGLMYFEIAPINTLRSAMDMAEGQAQSQFSLISDNSSVQVKVNGMPNVQKAQLVTIAGRMVDMVQNVKGGFVLGSGLSAGVYVVNIVYDNNQVFTQKVNVR